jgi:hypothetical protein
MKNRIIIVALLILGCAQRAEGKIQSVSEVALRTGSFEMLLQPGLQTDLDISQLKTKVSEVTWGNQSIISADLIKVKGISRAIRVAPLVMSGSTNMNIWTNNGRYSLKLRIAKTLNPTTIWRAQKVEGSGVVPTLAMGQRLKPGQKDIITLLREDIEALEIFLAEIIEQLIKRVSNQNVPEPPKVITLGEEKSTDLTVERNSEPTAVSVVTEKSVSRTISTDSAVTESTESTSTTDRKITLRVARSSHPTLNVPGSPSTILHSIDIPMGENDVISADYLLDIPYIKDPIKRAKLTSFINALIKGDGLEVSLKSSGFTIDDVRKLLESYG